MIPLTARRQAAGFAALQQIEAYWEGLRIGRALPGRADIEPRGMEAVLEYAFVIERIAPGLGRLRLAGMHLADLMGLDVRGMPATALMMPDSRAQLSRLFEEACTTPARVTLALRGEAGLGRGPLEARMIFLPLAPEPGQPARLLGCLQSLGGIGRQPRRFAITDSLVRPVTGAAPLVEPPQTRPLPQPGFQETAPAPRVPAGRARLTLLRGGLDQS